jgi:hypothetical protein
VFAVAVSGTGAPTTFPVPTLAQFLGALEFKLLISCGLGALGGEAVLFLRDLCGLGGEALDCRHHYHHA